MTQAQLDRQNQLEQTSSDLTTQPVFIDSSVFFLEPIDQVNAHPSEQIEQTEHTKSSKVHSSPDNTHEIPSQPKKTLSFSLRLSFLLQYLLNLYFLQIVMIT